MPIVTAPSRGQSNGEETTEFLDTVSTTPTTYTFQSTQEKLKVKNNGYAAVQVTVNGATMTLFPTESKEFYGSIDSFIVASTGGVQSFEVVGSNYKDEELKLTGSYAQEPFSGTSNTTKTFTKSMKGFVISNDGASDLTFMVNGGTFTVKPGEVFGESFAPFTQVIVTTAVPFRAYGLGD